MDKDKLILLEKFIENSITEDECTFFIKAVEHDDSFAEEAADIFRMQGLLASTTHKDSLCEELTRRVDNAIGDKRKFSTFENRVMKRVRRTGSKRHKAFQSIVWVSLAACFMIVAGAYFYNIRQVLHASDLIRAKLTEIHGSVLIEHNGVQTPVKEGMELFSGDRIETGKEGKVRVEYIDEDTVISISEEAQMSLFQKNGGKQLHLKAGEIDCDVAGQAVGKVMKLITSHATAEVIGTSFMLQVSRNRNSTRLEVREGLVRLERHDNGKSVKVSAGHYSEAGPHIDTVVKAIGKELLNTNVSKTGNMFGEPYTCWTFEDGPPDDIVLIKGEWEWIPKHKGNKACMQIASPDIYAIPQNLIFGSRPFMVILTGRPLPATVKRGPQTVIGASWRGKTKVLHYKLWEAQSNFSMIKDIIQTKHVFYEDYVMNYTEDKCCSIYKYKNLYIDTHLSFNFENIRIEKIKIYFLSDDEIRRCNPRTLTRLMKGPFNKRESTFK